METKPETQDEPLHCWAFVEIMGHSKIAGRVTERKVGPSVMIQVDVPKGDAEFSYSRLFNPSSLFSITPTDEAWCRKWAKQAEAYDLKPLPYIAAEKPALMNDQEDYKERERDSIDYERNE